MRVIPYSRQYINEDDINAVINILKNDWLTQGPTIEKFERTIAEYCGAKYAVAVSSGTAALHLACLVAGIGRNDEVITSPITFVASANCALYVGAKPVFVDVDSDTICLNPQNLEEYLNAKYSTKSLSRHFTTPKAVIPVHFAGVPCDMEAIRKIAEKYKLLIIEDACHALGAEYRIGEKWNKVGSCTHSDMAVFSFHPLKHITTGEGGAITTNNLELYKKLLLLRTHGITRTHTNFINKDLAFSVPKNTVYDVCQVSSKVNPWYYEMQELGFNYRITDLQCALGLTQFEKLDYFVARRREIASKYNEAFKGIECIKTMKEPEKSKSTWHLYVLRIDFQRLGKSRSSVMNKLREKGIGTQVHYIPVHLQPYYKKMGYKKGDYPVAEQYYKLCLSLPLFPGLSKKDIGLIISTIREEFQYENAAY
jgi:perosamine synthetase